MYQAVFKNYQCPGTETVIAPHLIIQVIHCQTGLRGNNKVKVKCPGLESRGGNLAGNEQSGRTL